MTNHNENQFSGYKLSESILEALELLGYKTPTRIQQEVIPVILGGNNVVVNAPTGSGKTAAFSIPICERIVWEENLPQGLILEPTRELSVQVKEETFFIGRKKRLKVPAVFGGFPIDKQIQTLKQKSHLVVGTPGRVMDHIRRGSLKLDGLTHLVIDEADLMLDMGFIGEVKEILSLIPATCKLSLFSATLEPKIQELVDEYMQEAVLIIQKPKEEKSGAIVQKIYEAGEDRGQQKDSYGQKNQVSKYKTFLNILFEENPKYCIIFCGTKEMVNVLFQKLRKNRVFCGMLHGDMEQKERLKTIEAFRRGGFRFLIATDVAARGIDFDHITHIINYDFPTGKETYVHRIGRTGRNGKTGIAISLVGEEDVRMLRAVEEYTGWELPVLSAPAADERTEKEFYQSQRSKIKQRPGKGEAFNRDIQRIAIGGGRKSKIRSGDIVGAISNIDGIAAEDIGVIDIRDSLSYVEILNNKGNLVVDALQVKPLKGKIRKVRKVKGITNG